MRATFICAAIFFITPIAAVMAYNYHVDRFQYYHTHEGTPIYSSNERWQNPGLIRTHDYDTVIIGTSRSQNFLPEMFESWRILKTTAAGASAEEQLMTLGLVLQQAKAER